MFWLAGARQIMIFARKHHNLGGYAEMPESTEPLLTLFQRHSKVIIRMQDQGGRLHVLSVLQRRTIPKKVKPLEQVAAKVRRVSIGAIARAFIGNEIRDTPQSNGCFETIRVTNDPVGHEAPIASARHSHATSIQPRIFLQRCIDAIHDVLIIFATPLSRDPSLEFLTIASRAARICKYNGITLCRVHLKLMKPIYAVLSRRTAVHT